MKTSRNDLLKLESYRLSGIAKHYIYNKYAVFFTEKKINYLRSVFYWFKFNLKEEFFLKKDFFIFIIKFLISFCGVYELSDKKRVFKNEKLKIYIDEFEYLKNYFKNELKLLEITGKSLKVKFYGVDSSFDFLFFLDKNFYSLTKIEVVNGVYDFDIFIFFYGEKFDIIKKVSELGGKIIEFV